MRQDICELVSKNSSLNEILYTQPYIIAEIGVNHEGCLDLAKRQINEAAEGGADAVKFQTYKAETIACVDSPSYWDTNKEKTKSQYELFKKYDKFWKNEFEILSEYACEAGVDFLSTPFDDESATFLAELMPAYKISSSDLNNLPFIDIICSHHKPIILSTGAAYIWEISQTVEFIKNRDIDVALLHCVLNYPTMDENANLGAIQNIARHFPGHTVGYSDHTLPKQMETMKTAYLLGAKILEKHFTHDKTLPGNDHYHAMDKKDLVTLRENIQHSIDLIGSGIKTPDQHELSARTFARRSLVSSIDIPVGTILTRDMITYKRPGTGIDPRMIDKLIGRRATVSIRADQQIQWENTEL